MNSSELHCIIDCSGSMAEYGKPMLLVNLLRYIRQLSSQHSEKIRFLAWGEGFAEIDWLAAMDVELPCPGGGGDVSDLCSWGEANSQAVLLLLTDGYFEINAEQRHQLARLDNLYLIGVGGDADLAKLNTLSNHSYRAEQLDYVLHTIWRSAPAIEAPSRRASLAQRGSEEDDEWS